MTTTYLPTDDILPQVQATLVAMLEQLKTTDKTPDEAWERIAKAGTLLEQSQDHMCLAVCQQHKTSRQTIRRKHRMAEDLLTGLWKQLMPGQTFRHTNWLGWESAG